MPVFPPYFPNLVEVRQIGTLPNGEPWNNVFFVEREGVGSFLAEATEIADAFNGAYLQIRDRIGADVGFARIDLVDRSVEGGELRSLVQAYNGLDATQILPGQVALVVSWRTTGTGRRRRGRTYLAGFTEAVNSSAGFPASAAVTDVENVFNELISVLAAAGHTLVILSRGGPTTLKDGTVQVWTPFTTPVFAAAVNPVFDTQRRRGS